MTYSINIERLKTHILALANIGKNPEDRGIYRTAFSTADMEGKHWLKQQIEKAQLEYRMDGAANVFGKLSGTDPESPAIVVGSHIDTVPCAGALDGTLGVLTALESLTCLREQGIATQRNIELVAFSDEEGRFGGMFGSGAFCGSITPETLEYYSDLEKKTLAEAMRTQQLNPLDALSASRDPNTIDAYLELHIEQGPVLDQKQKQVGIVESITGLFKWLVRIKGSANHAGTTPMEMRNDAFLGLAELANEIPRILEENGSENSRATIGKAHILPGAPNTVPGLVEFSLDVRDPSESTLTDLGEAFHKALSAIVRRRRLMFDYEIQSTIKPVQCANELTGLLEKQASALQLDYQRMLSGAAHDAQIVASITPVAMIFVPSKDGQSHSPAEWTDWNDIEAGANLMLNTLAELANR